VCVATELEEGGARSREHSRRLRDQRVGKCVFKGQKSVCVCVCVCVTELEEALLRAGTSRLRSEGGSVLII
jgi:hypothetical protein